MENIDKLLKEFIEEFHIPPFEKEERLMVLINEADQYLKSLVENTDYDSDMVARGLLKYRAYYSYCSRRNEFFIDYGNSIIEWQFSRLKGSDENVDTSI